jgi:hypothetical protein
MFYNCIFILTCWRTESEGRTEHWPNKASCPAEVEESGPAGVICTVINGPCCLSWQRLFSCHLPAIPAAAKRIQPTFITEITYFNKPFACMGLRAVSLAVRPLDKKTVCPHPPPPQGKNDAWNHYPGSWIKFFYLLLPYYIRLFAHFPPYVSAQSLSPSALRSSPLIRAHSCSRFIFVFQFPDCLSWLITSRNDLTVSIFWPLTRNHKKAIQYIH